MLVDVDVVGIIWSSCDCGCAVEGVNARAAIEII